jgi:hypothetical protein
MGKVIPLGCVTRLDLPPNRILDAARDELESVVLLGYSATGEEYFATSLADGGGVLWLLERCKAALLAMPDTET